MIKKQCSSDNLQTENHLEKELHFGFISYHPQELLEVVHLGFVPAGSLCPGSTWVIEAALRRSTQLWRHFQQQLSLVANNFANGAGCQIYTFGKSLQEAYRDYNVLGLYFQRCFIK